MRLGRYVTGRVLAAVLIALVFAALRATGVLASHGGTTVNGALTHAAGTFYSAWYYGTAASAVVGDVPGTWDSSGGSFVIECTGGGTDARDTYAFVGTQHGVTGDHYAFTWNALPAECVGPSGQFRLKITSPGADLTGLTYGVSYTPGSAPTPTPTPTPTATPTAPPAGAVCQDGANPCYVQLTTADRGRIDGLGLTMVLLGSVSGFFLASTFVVNALRRR